MKYCYSGKSLALGCLVLDFKDKRAHKYCYVGNMRPSDDNRACRIHRIVLFTVIAVI
jgi:hypothetical protein